MEQIIDWNGKLLPIAGELEGKKITEARPLIVEKLKEKGLLVSVDTEYKNVVKRCYKCNTMIEPQIKDQWFVKMAPLAEKALEAVNAKQTRFIPDHEEKIFRHWMENTLDWNISRQIVWGISIPAWFKDGEARASLESPGEGWVQDTDTFDTWFSSGQWPLMTTGYPDGVDFNTYYPTNVMETGRDILFFWVARMMCFGLYLTGKTPFHTVYLHGLVNDAHNKKMSKSKGNVINPLELTEKYGTDALRMALVIGNTPGTDLALREDKIKGYKHFANKLWNISRFIFENTNGADVEASRTESDEQLIEELADITADVTKDYEEYRIYLAAEKLYHYAWDRLAAEILEDSKKIFTSGNAEEISSRKATLLLLLQTTLTLLHPIIPFVTEEIYQSHPLKKAEYLMIENWPV
jgi:valyl-tRNA synthetase